MSVESSTPPRRQDIAGLRAVAVLLVVAFHAGLPLPGGFVGVDVFFVISGYFMAQIIVGDIQETGSVRFKLFYARRIRRLLPALTLVLLVTTLVGLVIQEPFKNLQVTAGSGFAAALFLGNFPPLALSGDYFSPSGDLNPFLHMWSLGVEEQFYLFFPVFLLASAVVGRRLGLADRRSILLAIGAISAASFLLSLYISEGGAVFGHVRPALAFYMFPTRVWEFGVGALVALLPLGRATWWRPVAALLAAAGVATIVASGLLITGAMSFPGVVALAPVLGTAAIFYAGRLATTTTARLLGSRPMTSIGNVSYSWYLWHWPAVVFVRYYSDSPWALVAASVAALGLSYLTYHFVEEPFRHARVPLARRPARLALTTVTASLAVCGLVVAGNFASWERPSLRALQESRVEALGARAGCTVSGVATPDLFERCSWAPSDPDGWVQVMGDSHAGSMIDGVISAAGPLQLGVVAATGGNCSATPASAHQVVALSNCAELYEWNMDRALQPSGGPSLVVIAHNSSARAVDSGGVEPWIAYLRDTLDALQSADVPVLLVLEVPRINHLPTNCRFGVILPLDCDASRAESDAVTGEVRVAEADLASEYPAGVTVVDPTATFCDERTCRGRAGDTLLYADDQHLTEAGSNLLAPAFTDAMERALAYRRR